MEEGWLLSIGAQLADKKGLLRAATGLSQDLFWAK